ncbi:MAG: HipA domain-containing protein [Dokdonella sp.]|uniref:type II toxin-antitoxin system HipA family toxin n=1 Tax=Dokdonella sp. TaxID=2291710 RepID=UPI0032655E58
MNEAEVWIDDDSLGPPVRVGQLTRNSSKTGDTVRFDYASEWLQQTDPTASFPLDHELPLAGGALYAHSGADQLSGSFEDASPDRWGKLLMERREAIEAREQQRPVRILRSWDFLLGVNDESRMGALRLRDPESGGYVDARNLTAPPIAALRELEAAAERVERGDDEQVDPWIRQLIAPGASLGGARPKASFRDTEGRLWLAKFPSMEDRRDMGLWEFLTWQLSRDAGIAVPPARVLKLSRRGHTFAVQRFDRTLDSRRLYSSAMTRLARDESAGASYLDIVEVIENEGSSTQIGDQLAQLFRRVLFNILIGNRDDHLRNHGFLRDGNGWVLSPAFDVNPKPDKSTHVLSIDGDDASPDASLLLATTEFYRLTPKAAQAIEREVRDAVRGWEPRAKALRLRKAETESMRQVIDAER